MGNRFLVAVVVEEAQIQEGTGTAVPQASRTQRFQALEGGHKLIGDDGAWIGRVPQEAVALAAAGTVGESDCEDPVTEMLVGRVVRGLQYRQQGQRVEGCVNLVV